MDLILDSSALLSGKFTSLPRGFDSVLITDEVRKEVSKGRPEKLLSSLLDAGLKVLGPVDKDKATDAARKTGDLPKLSEADLSVIALALERQTVIVVTDDFAVQNVLSFLHIRFTGGGELGDRTIRETRILKPRCRGCGRFYTDMAMKECPICGSEVRPVRSRDRIR